MGKTASKLKSRRSQSIAWSFRFPSMGTLHNLSASGRRRKKDGISSSVSCKDLRPNRHTIYLQPEIIIHNKEPCLIVTPPSPDDLTRRNQCSSSSTVSSEDREDPLYDASTQAGTPERTLKTDLDSTKSMEAPEDTSRKLLERELRFLDPRDLRSHAWYHGSTLRGGRKGAEARVPDDGDFLVRDCASQPGNYVLTVRWKSQPLHFVINRVVLQPDTVYERAQYQFEDEAFDTVADLITFYAGSGRPISQASGARIVTPKPRSVPLSCAASTATGIRHCSSPSSTSINTGSPPRLPRKQQRSHSLTASQQEQQPANHNSSSQLLKQSSTLPRVPPIPNQPASSCLSLGRQKISRVISDPALKQQQPLPPSPPPPPPPPPPVSQNSGSAPPKPPRVPYVPSQSLQKPQKHHHHPHHHHHHQAYQASGSDSGNGSGDSEFETNNSSGTSSSNPSTSLPIKGVVIRSHYSDIQDEGMNGAAAAVRNEQLVAGAPSFEVTTVLDVEGFNTLLLPAGDHRPLDPTALRGVSGMLHDSAPRVLASHLTRIDLELALQARPSGGRNGLSGIELVTLPHGRQARMDLIERSECIKLLVAVTILAGATAMERAATISKWIKVAIDTKTALGNLYGFCGVMLGLCLPQIQRLANTWHFLRQKYTDEAFNFEAKLRPTLRAMNECTNPQAPNTTLPHLLPIALLGERGPEDVSGNTSSSGLAAAILSPWENSASDCGLSILWSHLEASRKLAESLPLFRRNAEIALEGSRSDELLSDAFRTEFHIKFLWGSRGANVAAPERHLKFIQVLDAMYDKCAASEVSA